MNLKYLVTIFIVALNTMNAGCTTMVLARDATSTQTRLHKPGRKIKDIHIFLKDKRLVVQYKGMEVTRRNNTTKSSVFNIEATYDLSKSIRMDKNHPGIFITKPVDYSESHHTYKLRDGWKALPILLEVSDKINKYSYIADIGTDLSLDKYDQYIKRNTGVMNGYLSLIHNSRNKGSLIAASILPSTNRGAVLSNTFDRKAVFTDTKNGSTISYILMAPAYKVTSGNEKKLGLILLPVTAAIDIVTSPIQIPLLIEASKIGN